MKKILILGNEWKVFQDKTMAGAEFDSSKREIILGSLYPKHLLHNLLHEVSEAVLLGIGVRYDRYINGGNDGRMFIMTHAEFDSFSGLFASSLYPFLKEDMFKNLPNVGQKKKTKALTSKKKNVTKRKK